MPVNVNTALGIQKQAILIMDTAIPESVNLGTVLFVLVILVIIGFIGYRYGYLPRISSDGKLPWERKS